MREIINITITELIGQFNEQPQNNINDKIDELINIENPTQKQLYVFKTILGWAENNDITPQTLHVDGRVEDDEGDVHNSPIDQVPVESKEQLIVLADHDANLDKIFFSPEGSADGRNIINSLDAMEGIELTEETPTFEEELEEHLSAHTIQNR